MMLPNHRAIRIDPPMGGGVYFLTNPRVFGSETLPASAPFTEFGKGGTATA